jgi:hypothetical protein
VPSNYLHKFNTDNVHARAVIVGLVNLLNSKVQFENIYSDTDTQIVEVPFYYNFGGDERFLQDYFLQWNECLTPKMVDGNVDPIPRGIVTLESSTINTNMLTNRFIRGNYVKQVGNEVLTYNAFLNPIPLTMNFTVKIVTDTSLDAFKVQQAVLETFYKTQVFSVEFKGFRVPCQVGFPEDQGIEKTFEFTYQSETEISFNCPLQLETYFPVTDPTTERFAGNRMNYPGGPNVEWSSDETYAQPRFTIASPSHQETYFSTGTMPIEWSNTGPITRVNIYWRIVGDVDWTPIVKNYQNSGSYVWMVPFLNTSGTIVPKETTKAFMQTATGEGSKLRAIIDALGSVDNIIVLDGGFAYEGTDEIIVNDESLVVTAPTISPNVVSGTITGSTIYAVGSGFTPTPVNQIEIKVENANNERVYEIMKREITYQAQVTNGSDLLSNIVPDISVAQNLTDLALYVGMPVSGAGIPTGAYIIQILSGTNQIQISTNANLSSALTLINGGKLDGFVTIK